jgi:hypothetical protein
MNFMDAILLGQDEASHASCVLRGRVFDGKCEARGKTYGVVFLPNQATLVDRQLVLTGRMGFSVPGKLLDMSTTLLQV